MPRPRLGRVTVTRSGRAFCQRAFSPPAKVPSRASPSPSAQRAWEPSAIQHVASAALGTGVPSTPFSRGTVRTALQSTSYTPSGAPLKDGSPRIHVGTGVPPCTVDLTTSSHQHRRVFEVWVILRAVSGDVADAAARVRPPPLTTHPFPPGPLRPTCEHATEELYSVQSGSVAFPSCVVPDENRAGLVAIRHVP